MAIPGNPFTNAYGTSIAKAVTGAAPGVPKVAGNKVKSPKQAVAAAIKAKKSKGAPGIA